MEIIEVEINKLIPAEYNPRLLTKKAKAEIWESILQFGMVEPIVVNNAKGRENVIIGGHQRWYILKEMGKTTIPVVYVTIDDLKREKELNLRLNKNVGDWDWDMLVNFDKELLKTIGFDEELDKLFLKEELLNEEPIKDIKDIKILNLYAGIGGNRALWGEDVKVTAVEYDNKIAKVYKDYFPNDEVIINDAHVYLEKNFDKFDFIWTSPPCPTHSRLRKNFEKQNKPIYPDMRLWQEILFLQGYFKGKWLVENVITWYDPLIKPQERGRHYYWSNFEILESSIFDKKEIITIDRFRLHEKNFNFDLSKYENIGKTQKNIMLRNMVHPEVGKFILESALGKI